MDAELIYLVGLDWAEFALRWLYVITAIVRLVCFIYVSGSGPAQRQAPAGRCAWRRMAGAVAAVLSYPEISGRAGRIAGTSDLVQMGILCHMAVRFCADGGCVLSGGGSVSG